MNSGEKNNLVRFAGDAAICSVFIVIFLAIMLVISRNGDAYGGAIVTKDAWLKTAPSPRLIMVGGSGLAFGTDSEKIESETGFHPINLGLYGTAGMGFMLSEVVKNTKAGDTIFLVPDYETLEADPSGMGFILLEMLQSDPRTIRYMGNGESWLHIVRDFPGWLETRVYSFLARHVVARVFDRESTLYRRVYTASNFNHYGDMVGHLTETTHLTTIDMQNGAAGAFSGKVSEKTIDLLLSFIKQEEASSARVYLTWQAVPQTLYDANKTQIDAESKTVEGALGGTYILGTPEDYVYPDTYFFDTPGHLSSVGRVERTKKFIEFINRGIVKK